MGKGQPQVVFCSLVQDRQRCDFLVESFHGYFEILGLRYSISEWFPVSLNGSEQTDIKIDFLDKS